MRQYETFVGPALWSSDVPDASDFDILYSVAEWIPGEALSTAVVALEPTQSLQLVGQVAQAVNFLHNVSDPLALNGIVHRDIKPSNVHITPNGEAVLLDFGMAKPQDENEMTLGAGTFLWRAPEVLGGPGLPGKESDVWGIGALAYWVIVGEPTRLEGAEAAREQILQKARELELADPPALASHISSLLESRPGGRPSDLDVWASVLASIQSGARRRARNMRKGLVVAVAAVLIAGATITIADFVKPPPGTPAVLTLLADSSGKSTSQIWTIRCNAERHFLSGSGVQAGSKIDATFSNTASNTISASETVRALKDGHFRIPWACGVSQIESSWSLVVTTPHQQGKRTVTVMGSAPITSLQLATLKTVSENNGVFTAKAGSSIAFHIYGTNRQGRLIGPNGLPIADGKLSRQLQSSVTSTPHGIASVEDRNGEFVLTDLSPGTVLVVISAPGLGTTESFKFVGSATSTTKNVTPSSGSRGGGRGSSTTSVPTTIVTVPTRVTTTTVKTRETTTTVKARVTTPTVVLGGSYLETAGSAVHTWTDYSDGGGTEGAEIASNQSVQIACRLTGFTVADGNQWWYKIASSPWNSSYYVSADAFYNNGVTSGSLIGTPFYDPNVPLCPS
jgi:hypothetical protein